MSDKRRADKHKAYQTLTRAGLEFDNFNHISPNAGSETFPHVVAKSAAMQVGLANGYWVASEVNTPHGEIDVLLWGNPERLTLAVEVETSPTAEVKQDKLERYVKKQSGIDDMALINVTEMPKDLHSALGFIITELGLDV